VSTRRLTAVAVQEQADGKVTKPSVFISYNGMNESFE
jgi:hypothetical protein